MTVPWPTALRTALRRGQLLVAEVPATAPDRRAWVAVYPLGRPPTAFNLFHREVGRAHLDNDWCVGPDDGLIELRQARATDEVELTRLLAGWAVHPADLTYAHRSDYPL